MAEADPSFDPATAEAAPPAPARKHLLRKLAMFSVPVLLVLGGGAYWLSLQGKVSTDNAYVHQNKVSVSAEVGGRIVEVAVRENQEVKPGDLLFRIDPESYRLQLSQADAAIAGAQASWVSLSNNSAMSGADISAAQEDIGFAQANLARQQALWQKGFTTKAAYEAAQHQVAQAREELRIAQAKRTEAAAMLSTGSQVPGVFPQLAAARAQRASAELALSRTEVRAPIGGTVAEADRLQIGQEAVTGLPMLMLVDNRHSWVEANFKETDLAKMRVGQRAELTFDAYPGVKVSGHVASIGAGTGSEFSVLPAQNATGNWVKVTQRVPVRIAIDGKSERPLIAGLSAHVTVFTAKAN